MHHLNVSEGCFKDIVGLIEGYLKESFNWQAKYRKKDYSNLSPEVQAEIATRAEKFKKLGMRQKTARPGFNDKTTRQVANNTLERKKKLQSIKPEDKPQENILKANIENLKKLQNKKDIEAISKNQQLQSDYENITQQNIEEFRKLGKERQKRRNK